MFGFLARMKVLQWNGFGIAELGAGNRLVHGLGKVMCSLDFGSLPEYGLIMVVVQWISVLGNCILLMSSRVFPHVLCDILLVAEQSHKAIIKAL